MLKNQKINDSEMISLADYCTTIVQQPIPGLKDFVGIYQKHPGEHPMIYLPNGFPNPKLMSQDNLRKSLTCLFQVILRSGRELEQKGVDVSTGSVDTDFPFDSYYRLILDYLQNGMILEPERVEKKYGSGRNDWSKTLSKTQPIWTDQGPVYLEPIKIRTVYSELELKEIQSYCLQVSDSQIGWLFGRPNSLKIEWDRSKILSSIQYVEVSKNKTYNTRKSNILSDMSIILRRQLDRSLDSTNYLSLGVRDYMHKIWENMIEHLFGSGVSTELKPKAQWFFKDGTQKEASGDMLPDSIRFDEVDGKIICSIIDAKYKRDGLIPATSEINKQITYGDWVDKLKHGNCDLIQNMFFIPKFLDNRVSEYAGFATMGPLNDSTKYHHKIHLIYLDTLSLMEHYLKNNYSHIHDICHGHDFGGV